MEQYENAKLKFFLNKEPIQFKEWLYQSLNIVRIILFIVTIEFIIAIVSFVRLYQGPAGVGINWIDIYSFAHVFFGISTFFCLSFYYFIPLYNGKEVLISLRLCYVLTLIILVGWELLENLLFINIGIKPKLDSPINITIDLVLGIIGAALQLIFARYVIEQKKNLSVYYVFGVISILINVGSLIIISFFPI